MFMKQNDTTSRDTTAPNMSKPSLIGADIKLVGNIVSNEELHIEGDIEGDIIGQDILIQSTGKVTGTIKCKRITIHGQMNGTVSSDLVSLTPTAKVKGDLCQKSLSVELGAYFEGRSSQLPTTKDLRSPVSVVRQGAKKTDHDASRSLNVGQIDTN